MFISLLVNCRLIGRKKDDAQNIFSDSAVHIYYSKLVFTKKINVQFIYWNLRNYKNAFLLKVWEQTASVP